MSSIERTAYPRLVSSRAIKERELEQFYSLTPDEMLYLNQNIRGSQMRFNFAVQLKTFQRLGYFPEFKNIPKSITGHIQKFIGLSGTDMIPFYDHDKTRRNHQNSICAYLKVNRWKKATTNDGSKDPRHPGRRLAASVAYQAAQTMNNPADIINVVIEELVRNSFELPSFDQINRLVKHARSIVNQKIFRQIHGQLEPSLLKMLDDLFIMKPGYNKTGYNSLKRLPKSPTITHFKELIEHHNWLVLFGSTEKYLTGISKIKLQQFSVEAKSLDASDFKDMNIYRRSALIICLIRHAQRKSKDALAIMYSKTMSKLHKKADEKYEKLKEKREEITQNLVGAFYDVLKVCKEDESPEIIGKNIEIKLSDHGGTEKLHDECEQIIAFHEEGNLALLW